MKSSTLGAAISLACILALSATPSFAAPDAVSAASLVLSVNNLTDTTATITVDRDRYDYGTRTLCYDPAPAVAKNNCETKTATSKSGMTFSIKGLDPNTKYNFNVNAIDTRSRERPYNTSGSFTTKEAAPVSIFQGLGQSQQKPTEGAELKVDALGRHMDLRWMKSQLKTLRIIR